MNINKKILVLLFCAVSLCSCSNIGYTEISKTAETTQDTAPVTPSVSAQDTQGNRIYSNYLDELQRQKSLSHTIDFKPIKDGFPAECGNQPQNLKNGVCPGVICYDDKRDILYFTDLSGSNTLCKLENGAVTELVPVTAQCLNLWDGYLYYICNTEKPVGLDFPLMCAYGDIYRYNLETGENQIFIETKATALAVTEKGIEYTAGEKYVYELDNIENTAVDERIYLTDFENKSTCESGIYPVVESCLGLYYGEGKISPEEGAIALTYNNGEKAELLSRETVNVYLTLYNDLLCSRNKLSSLYCLNLKTGKEEINEGFSIIQDYVWIEDTLYLSDGSSLYKCKNGEKQRFYIEQQNPAHPVDFSVLQTDGERLYVVTSSGKLYLLTLNETETVYELKNLY